MDHPTRTRNSYNRRTLELLTLAALKWGEISEGRARELLGWSRKKIRDEQKRRVGIVDYGTLVDALDIMDSKGRSNPERNSTMLWNKEWDRLRGILFMMLETTDDG
ncbi:MAG: hypothetical protein ACYTEX_24320 [Planctomycetota bacterium]|jgi:hypothetical protein